jgi:hypothetical protein
MGLVTNFGGLVAMRLLVGLFEAGLFPGTLRTLLIGNVPDLNRVRLSDFDVL